MIKVAAQIIGSDRLEDALDELGHRMRGGIREAAEQAARGFVRRVVVVTAPASGGVTGLAARKQGERKIDSELARVFVPVRLRGKRPEQNPDVYGLYEQYVLPRKGRRGLKGGNLGHRFWVDEDKFDALRKSLVDEVGFLAGGWNAAAEALGVPVPAWIARHGTGQGTCEILVEENRIRILIGNNVDYSSDVDGFERRARAALDYQAEAFEEEVEFLRERELSATGLR